MEPVSIQTASEEIAGVCGGSRKTNRVSWRMIAEGTLFGFLSMLIAEEPVLNRMMPVAWLFFLTYLICRCRAHYLPMPANQLNRIGRTFRVWAWILISGATLVASVGQ